MTRRWVVPALLAVLMLAEVSAARPWMMRCRDHFRTYPPYEGMVGLCTYTHVNGTIAAGTIPGSVCDGPLPVNVAVCARYNREVDYSWEAGIYRLVPDEDVSDRTCIQGETIHRFKCVDLKPMATICSRVFAEE